MQYSGGNDDPATDRRVGALAQQLGTVVQVGRIQERAVAQAVEGAQADLAAAKAHVLNALARLERCQDDLAEARRLALRRDATASHVRDLVRQLVQLVGETGGGHDTHDRQDPDDLHAAGRVARHTGSV